MANSGQIPALAVQLSQLEGGELFNVIKDTLLANIDVASAIVTFFKDFLNEQQLPTGAPAIAAAPRVAQPPPTRRRGFDPVDYNTKTAEDYNVSSIIATEMCTQPVTIHNVHTKQEDGLCWGFVASRDFAKGVCSVTCENDQGAVIPSAAAHPQDLPDGGLVAFGVSLDDQGQTVGFAPVWTLVGFGGGMEQGKPLPIGKYVGQVRSIHVSGIAFLDCPPAEAVLGRQPAAHANVVQETGMQVGDVIAFDTVTGASGKVWVSSPCWKSCSPAAVTFPHPFPKTYKKNPPLQAFPAAPVEWALNMPISADELRLCTVASKQTDGHGITCPGIEGQVFVDLSVAQLTELSVGETVACRIQGSALGRLQAIAPLWKRAGFDQKEKAAGTTEFGPFFGELRQGARGDICFITSEQVDAAFGRSAAAHATIMTQCGLASGDILAFQCIANASGKIWLSAPCWKCCSPEPNSIKEFIAAWTATHANMMPTPLQMPPEMIQEAQQQQQQHQQQQQQQHQQQAAPRNPEMQQMMDKLILQHPPQQFRQQDEVGQRWDDVRQQETPQQTPPGLGTEPRPRKMLKPTLTFRS